MPCHITYHVIGHVQRHYRRYGWIRRRKDIRTTLRYRTVYCMYVCIKTSSLFRSRLCVFIFLNKQTAHIRQYIFNIKPPVSLLSLPPSPQNVHDNKSSHYPRRPVEIPLPLTYLPTPLSRIRLRISPCSPIITP